MTSYALVVQDYSAPGSGRHNTVAAVYTDAADQVTQIKKLIRRAADIDLGVTHSILEYHVADQEVVSHDEDSEDEEDYCCSESDCDCGRRKKREGPQWTSEQRKARVEELLQQAEGNSVDEWFELLNGGINDILDNHYEIMRGVVLGLGEKLEANEK